MSKKNRIFAAAIAVLLLALTSFGAFASFRLYEIDFKYDEKREEFQFTAVTGATYYEIRGYAPGETISNDTGTLIAKYTPDTVSTGDELYTIPLGQTPEVIDKASLDVLKSKPYYTLKVYAFQEAARVPHKVTVTANHCTANVTSTTVLDGGTFSVTFSDDSGSSLKTYYGTLTATMGGVDITGPEYGADGSNIFQVVYGDHETYVTVNNITGDVVISMTAAEPPAPATLDTPQAWIDGEFLKWDSVPNATEYYVEIYKGNPDSGGTYVYGGFTANTSIDVASHYTEDDFYNARVKACYSTTIVQSPYTSWFAFDFTEISTNPPTNAPMMDIDYSSTDTCIGESNPLTFVGTGAGICTKKHIVDEDGDGYDDASYSAGYDAGITYQKNVSGDSGVSDFITKILGAVTGGALYVGSNVKIAGISLISIAAILAVGVAIMIIFSFKKGS